MRGDESLYRMHWIEDLQIPEHELAECPSCGMRFERSHWRDEHCRKAEHDRMGNIVAHQDPEFPRTPEMEAKMPVPTRLEDDEPGGFIARIDEVDSRGARTVPAEYSQDERVREAAKRKRGRPRKVR